MLTGSFASSLHSIPRATRDLDIVIFPNRDQLLRFIGMLPAASYHADLAEATEALRVRGQFNVVDYATGWKVDFIIPPFTEFNIEEFERRITVELDDLKLVVLTAEDVVIAKLLWARAGESDKQIRDVATVLRSQGDDLDVLYVENWVKRLGLEKEWTTARSEAS